MAILLLEEGLYKNARIFATDANEAVLKKAHKGVFDADRMKTYTRNYIRAGGLESFSDYYTSRYGLVMMKNELKENIVFSHHNLVTDGVFGEMDMILCRNVLIYFNRDLQERVFNLFWQSLCPDGFLCLGASETIRFSKQAIFFTKKAELKKNWDFVASLVRIPGKRSNYMVNLCITIPVFLSLFKA
jgi:chemotaxis protein methyltransferase CheR